MINNSLSKNSPTSLSLLKDSKEKKKTQLEGNTINSLKIYYEMNLQFKSLGGSELTERMIRRITKCEQIPKDFQVRPLYINLSGITDELMLNELEIALWAIYLENLVWKHLDIYTEEFLLFSAYKAKQYFNGNSIEPFRAYLQLKIKNFDKNFNSWLIKYEGGFKVNLKMINEKLNTLKVVKDANSDYCALDYSYYVDMILLAAAPYVDRGDQIAVLKRKNEEYKNEKPKKKASMKVKMSKTEAVGMKKKKIEKDGISISTNSIEYDPDMTKIEMFCDGLVDCNDLDPNDF